MLTKKYPRTKPDTSGYYMFNVNGDWQARWFDGLDVSPRWAAEKNISQWRELTQEEWHSMPGYLQQ